MHMKVTSTSSVAPCSIHPPSANHTKLPGSYSPSWVLSTPSSTNMPCAHRWVCHTLVKPAGYRSIITCMPVSGSSNTGLIVICALIWGISMSAHGIRLVSVAVTLTMFVGTVVIASTPLRVGVTAGYYDKRSQLFHPSELQALADRTGA